jgi:hypothetical protein
MYECKGCRKNIESGNFYWMELGWGIISIHFYLCQDCFEKYTNNQLSLEELKLRFPVLDKIARRDISMANKSF